MICGHGHEKIQLFLPPGQQDNHFKCPTLVPKAINQIPAQCYPALSVLVMLVSRSVFHVVSALQSTVFTHFILADQISCRSYVGSVCRMLSLGVCKSLITFSIFSYTLSGLLSCRHTINNYSPKWRYINIHHFHRHRVE